MKPKNIHDYLLEWATHSVFYNRYYGNADDYRTWYHVAAEQAFRFDMPRDFLVSSWVTKFYWMNEVAMNHSAMSDRQFLESMLLSEIPVSMKNYRPNHVLTYDFFEDTDFDHENKVIRVPIERMVRMTKNIISADELQFIFIQSREPNQMIPFIYDSSIESNGGLYTNDDMYKHKFRPAKKSLGWRLEIIQPVGWTWKQTDATHTATPIVSKTTSSVNYYDKVTELLSQSIYNHTDPKIKPTMNIDEINKIFKDIQDTSSYLDLDNDYFTI